MVLAIFAPAFTPACAVEHHPDADATTGYLMRLSGSVEGDGDAYAPQASVNWEYLLSRLPHQEPLSGTAGQGSFNLDQLLEESKVKHKRARQVSEYERTLEAISAIHTTSTGEDTNRMISFENRDLELSDLINIYGAVQSSTSAKMDDFGDGSSCLNYLYHMSVTSMRSDAAHRMAPSQAPSDYNPLSTQISGDGEMPDLFADTYRYRKDTVNPDVSRSPAEFNGSADVSYSRSISNLAHLNSMASDQGNGVTHESYQSIESNLNTLLKNGEESDSIAGKSASIFSEYSLMYPNHSSRKHSSDKIAVVVGINGYSDRMRLHACVNDAKAMAELLGELGYEVVEITDESQIKPTKENILNVAIARIKSSRGKEKVVFYYSGHGETDENGTFYMVPQDSRRDPSTYISEYDLERYLKDIKNLAIIIDACHSGGMKDFVSEGQILITSSKNEEPSNELWNGEMSVFTYNLVSAIRAERMRDHEISLQSCFYRAREGTLKWPGQRLLKQNPVIVDRTGGSFRLA